jgi:peptidyl-prolyl cis-trans isomerase SurA
MRPFHSFSARLLCALLMCSASLWAQAQNLRQAPATGNPRLGLNVTPGLLAAPERSANFIVALVDSEPITNHDVRIAIERLRAQATQSGMTLPEPEQLARDALEMLIFERSQLQWAKLSGLRVSDEDINGVVETLAQRNQLSVDEFYRALERQGTSKKRFLDNLRDQQTLKRLRDRDVPGRIVVSEPEIDRYLSEQKAAMSQKGGLELAQILLPLADGASPEQIAQAEQTARGWLREISQGADFHAIARQRSGAPDRIEGGRMGLREADRYPELFLDATRNTPVGGVAGPIRSGAGFHLLKVVERRQAGVLTMAQTRARHILIKPGGNLSQNAVRLRLLQFKNDIESGRQDFAQMARQHSQDASAAQGGDLGWAVPGQFVPEFEQVMEGLQPGQISDPLLSRFGVHLIQVLERREVPLTPRQERDYAKDMLREAKYDQTLETWAREIRGKAYIEYREPPL